MGIAILFAGSIFYIFCYFVCLKSLKYKFYSRLSSADIYLIAEKLVNSLQALMTTAVGIIIARNCGQNIMTDVHWLTKTYAWFGLPYFVYDIWAMYNTHYYLNRSRIREMTVIQRIWDFARRNVAMLIHHTALPLVFFPVILFVRGDKGDYFVGILYTFEAAIPFVSLRFILVQLKKKNSPVYIVSGLLMIVVFFLVRVCIFPFLYWKYSEYANINFLDVPFRIPVKCNVGCILILIFQIYFLYLMIRGACRVFTKLRKRNS